MTQPAKILVVDDNPIVLLGLGHALRTAGYDVVEASSGLECMRQARETSPNLALLDAVLPDIHGVELCRQLKRAPDLDHIFVVLLSATEVSGDFKATGLEAGADDYIARPVENRELMARIEALLRIQRAEAGLRAAQTELERRVAERTEELVRANAALKEEVRTRQEAEEAQRRLAERLTIIHSVDQAILEARSAEEIASAALSRIHQLLPYEQASVWEANESQGQLNLLIAYESGSMMPGKRRHVPLEQVAHLRVIQAAQPFRMTRTTNLFDLGTTTESGVKQWQALIDVPLVARDKLTGVLNFASDKLGAFTREHEEIAREVAAQMAVALLQTRLFEQLVAGREHLRALSLRMVEVQEAERRFIARELHDEIGQMLTGLKLQLDLCLPLASGPLQTSLSEARGWVEDLMGQVRKLSLDLRPQILDDLGLLTALDWHFQRYTQLTGVRVDFRHTLPATRLPGHLETAMFRIVQEALTNVARHAGTKDVQVQLDLNPADLMFRIKDQGVGFNAARRTRGVSSGLDGMRERANLLGGEFHLESSPGQGTSISVRLPLEPTPSRSPVHLSP